MEEMNTISLLVAPGSTNGRAALWMKTLIADGLPRGRTSVLAGCEYALAAGEPGGASCFVGGKCD